MLKLSLTLPAILLCLGASLLFSAEAEKNVLGIQVVKDTLEYGVDADKPLNMLLSKSVYPAEDGHLDAIIWLNEKGDGQVPGKLAVSLLNLKKETIYEEEIQPIPGKTLFLAPKFPADMPKGVLRVQWIRDGLPARELSMAFRVEKSALVKTSGEIAIRIPNNTELTTVTAPITVGVPFPRGALRNIDSLRLTDKAGKEVPVQVEPVAWWSRFGSIKWVRCSFSASLTGSAANYRLHYGGTAASVPASAISVKDQTGFPRIQTDMLKVDDGIWRKDASGQWVKVFDEDALHGAFVEAENGSVFSMKANEAYTLESQGSESVTVLKKGWYQEGEKKFCQYVIRYIFARDSALVKIFHTWIFTGDSSEDRIRDMGWKFRMAQPLKKKEFLTTSGETKAGQYLLQFDYDKAKIVANGKTVFEDGRNPGVMIGENATASVTLGTPDFWQNFPTELEFTPDAMIFHVWPKHGELPSHPVKIEDALRLWFAHEGRVLDFSLPFEWSAKDEFYYTSPGPESRFKSYSTRGREHEMNAQGIAKTTEFWLYLGDPENSLGTQLMKALQVGGIQPVVDPVWVAASGAFYEIHPKDTERFPQEEAIFELQALAPLKWVDRIKFYGKWIYGDMTWEPDIRGEGFGFYRGFRKSHQGWPYSWIPYARSGDARLMKFADAATRHLTDTVFCHYSDERVPSPGTDRPRALGFHTRFPIPWASHSGRTSSRGYTDKCNYMWHSYYLTGYDRAKDVALEFGNATKYDGSNIWGVAFDDKANFNLPKDLEVPGNWPRYTTTMLQTYVEMYEATFDPWYLASAHQIAKKHLEYYKLTGWQGYYWNAGPREFLRFSGSPEYEKFYEAYAQKWTGPENVFSPYTANYPMMEAAAFAALKTGNPIYVSRLRGLVDDMIASTYDGSIDYLKGSRAHPGLNGSAMYTSYLLQYLPNALYTLAKAGKKVEPVQGKFFQCPVAPKSGDITIRFPDVRLEKSENEELSLRPLLSNLSAKTYDGMKFSVDDPRHERLVSIVFGAVKAPMESHSVQLRPTGISGPLPDQLIPNIKGIEAVIPAGDPAGIYSVNISSNAKVALTGKVPANPGLYLPLSKNTHEVFRLDKDHRVGPAYPLSRYAFQVPSGITSLRFTVYRPVAVIPKVTIWNQDGKCIARFPVDGKEFENPIQCEIDIPPGVAGQIWKLMIPHPHEGIDFDPAILPWVSTQRHTWFNPDKSSSTTAVAN